MSIASEITRISGNVSDALDAIEAKGVEIPTGANSDDLASLIASIPTGGSGITVVETEDSHGGTIVTITGEEVTLQSKTVTPTTTQQIVLPSTGYTALSQVTVNGFDYNWMGASPEFVSNIYPTKTYALSETGFNSWTPSTTALDIIAAQTLSPTYKVDFAQYEYLIRWRVNIHIALNSGATKKYQIEQTFGSLWQSLHRRPYGLADMTSITDSYNYCTTVLSGSNYVVYWNSSGTKTWTTTTSWGIYPTLTAATFSSTSSTTPNVTFKTPKITAKCNASYWTTARAGEVDKENSTVKIRGDLYRFKYGDGWTRQGYRDALEMYSTPL